MLKRLLPFFAFALLLVAGAGRAQAQDSLRVLIAEADGGSHRSQVENAFTRTADAYGLSLDTLALRRIGSNTRLVDIAIEQDYDLVLPARQPNVNTPDIADPSERAWANGVAFVSPHGPNEHKRHEATSGVSKRGPLFIGGENLTPGSERSYGKNLELDVLTLNGKSAQSYAPVAGAAILSWVYQTATDSTKPDSTRWRKARTMMRGLAGVYDSIETPSDLAAQDNILPSEVASFDRGQGYKDEVTNVDTLDDGSALEDGNARIKAEGGGSKLKYYKFEDGPFPAGIGFSEVTVTNLGNTKVKISRGYYGRKPVAPGETRTFVFRHPFQAKQRSTIKYRLWAPSAGDSVDVVFEPLIFDVRQPDLNPDYDNAPRTDERGEGLVIATLAGRPPSELTPAEQKYAQQQQERLDSVEANLPVELGGFTGRVDGRAAVLEWRTRSETNSRGFFVEKQTPGGNWRQVGGLIEGAGTTQQPQRYSKRVEGLDFGRHVFRLRQVDRDGGEEVFDQRRVELNVRMNDAYTLDAVYPNPTRGRATVSFAVQEPQAVTVALYNTLGQQVKVLKDGLVAGGETVTLTFDAGPLASGLYFVRLRGKDFSATESVTIVR
jgi:hypothetical protein